MKKALVLVAVVTIAISLFGCGSTAKGTYDSNYNSNPSSYK